MLSNDSWSEMHQTAVAREIARVGAEIMVELVKCLKDSDAPSVKGL